MALRKYIPSSDAPSLSMAPLNFRIKMHKKAQFVEPETAAGPPAEADVDVDLREVYFLIMHFLSDGPCQRTYGQLWNELLEHQLLPRRYHAWYSRSGARSRDENDDGLSFPLSYNKLVERHPHIEKDHLVKLLKQLILSTAPASHGMVGGNAPNAADVPTLLGSGSFSLLGSDRNREDKLVFHLPSYLRWPHIKADQVHGLSLREIGGGFTKHHRAPSIRAACYAIAKPSTMVQKMQNIKKLRGHRNAVYCAIFDRSGRYVITGSDDRLVKIWSMETAFCLASCRGHEGDITDLAVSSNNTLVASASNDFIIRVWRLPDGVPISVLRGHTGAVTAIAFSPRPSSVYHLLSSSDDGTCRIWDARHSLPSLRIYLPKPSDAVAGKSNGPSSSTGPQSHQVLCCAYNANGTVFVTGSSDTFARVWNACKSNTDDPEQPNHEMDVLSGHENDVNYVQFSVCAVASRSSITDISKEENIPKFKNSWFTHDNIVTCSRDGSAIIWIPKFGKSHGKVGRWTAWTRAYHLKVPPPPMPAQPSRGGPRQRFLPTPRGVNMIVWSLDNRFVLAAIMDCRICVWNAVDGSLVHSLTGHSESTYVLDVHPFNPRIAMSAGYDGKTIVWDIWEGTPIRIYETGRFKLVDGKFSPDGTSIVLSDDVGQMYILSTGQGESQKDAKYDQFFLGDYRPLVQDSHGNVLDQETQLVPYRRNIQDLLCDSGMIPYPEPYQSMYQKRRLGALGIEWCPSSVNLAVGAVDITGLQDYQILPVTDLDRLIEPIPEFIDAMDWEPENEVQSDDNDSEYNVTDEFPSDGEQGSLSNNSSGDPECSAEDSDFEQSHKDGFRRSKRKKLKADVEFMTSSGRRVKKRNLDERDGILSRSNKTRKSRNGPKASKRKSSTSKSLRRPQRVAARNALNFFSRITGASTDGEDDDGSETESSDCESVVPDSAIQNNESDRSIQNVQQKNQRGKEAALDEYEDITNSLNLPESQMNAGGRRRLVLKLPVRDSKLVSLENSRSERGKQVDLVCASKAPLETTKVNRNHLSSQVPGSSSGDMIDSVLSQNYGGSKSREREQSEKYEDPLDLSAGYKDNRIRWGEVKARTSKRLRSGDSVAFDACHGSNGAIDDNGIDNNANGHLKPDNNYGIASHSERQNHGDNTYRKACRDGEQFRDGLSEDLDDARNKEFASEYAHDSLQVEQSPLDDHQLRRGISLITCNGNLNKESKDQSGPSECMDDEPLERVESVADDKMASVFSYKNGTDHSQEVKEKNPPIPTKLTIRSKIIQRESGSPSKLKSITAVEDWRSSGCDLKSQNLSQNSISVVPEEDEGPSGLSPDNGNQNLSGKSEGEIENKSGLLILQDSKKLHSDLNNKMYNAVYKRSKSNRARTDLEGSGGAMEESTSNASNHNLDQRMDFPEAAIDGIRRTRSTGMKITIREPNIMNNNFKVREDHGSIETSRIAERFAMNTHEQFLCEEWRSNAKMTVGLRSARNRRGNYYDSDTHHLDKRKSHHLMRKLSWLMLLEHEECYRYIPQQGDEVVYLRQGHQQYIEWRHLSEVGPWRSLKGNLRAVEFCKVEGLEYSTLPGSGESCCKITLEFVDPSSSVFGKMFKLTLPELNDFSDFLVERTLYDSAINRNWTNRDKCLVWWRNEHEEGGSWWEGRIMSVKSKSTEFPDSPWERFAIRYKNDSAGGDHLHSPWELHDPDTPAEYPHIDDQSRTRILSFLTKLEQSGNKNQDRYGIQKLEQVSQKSDFLNRFPVPLSLDMIHSRLEHKYYRSLEALKHDFAVMLSNAQSYFGKNVELATKMRRLSERFNEMLLSL